MRRTSLLGGSALALAMLATALPVHAQDADDAASDDELRQSQIVVTGTRSADRTALETAVPVDVFPVAELTETGRTELNQILAATVPSFNFNQTSISDGSDIIRPATLRGLAPDQTLVLVNSKRRHSSSLVNINGTVGRGSSAVDLNSIPTAAIGSVQVLRDGASAQYGSDAIAGVINVLLKEESSGGGVNARYGAFVTDIDGQGRDAVDGETLQISGWKGFALGDSGFLTISAEYKDRNPSNRAGLDPRPQYITPGGVSDPRETTFNRLNHNWGNGNAEDFSAFANAGFEISPDWELYGWAGYQDREAESTGFYRRSSDSAPSPLGTRSTPRNLTEIHPDGFLPTIVGDVTDISAGGGVRGDLGGWDADFSIVYGSNELDYSVVNTLNASLGPSSQTEFDAGALKYDQIVVNAGVTQTFDNLLPGDTTLSFGLEYRDEGFEITAGEPNSYAQGGYRGIPGVNYEPILSPDPDANVPVGFDISNPATFPDPFDANFGVGFAGASQVFGGFTPQSEVDAGRDNIGIYADAEWEPNSQTLLSAAVRFEDYSDFGDTFTGKVTGRYDFNDTIAVRGAFSTGFRAPSLQQQFFTATSTNFIDGVPFEIGTLPASSSAAIALGAQPLDAEESTSFSAGVVLTPAENFFLTVDAYSIDIEDQIFLSENLGGAEVDAVLANAGVTGVGRLRFFQNGIETETRGVDVVARYDWDLGEMGEVGLSGAFNFSEVEVTNAPTNSVVPTLTFFSRNNRLTFEESAPETKLILSADYSWKDATINARATRYGEVIDPSNNPANDFTLEAAWIIDASVDVELTDNVTAGFGVDNVLDQYPTDTPAGQDFNGIFPFSARSPFGFAGRFVYGRVSVNW
ncbi:MAG: TonB-dependent receptor [Alphaproteobacteria bacterium]|jgi:iron complex outermembrane receptor protein|nr:TonB-dependent receptor [Alphaproteobacteria bacterium]